MKTNSIAPKSWSRRLILAGLAATLGPPIVPAHAGGKQTSGQSAAKAFLNSIYKEYLGSSSGTGKGIVLANAKLVHGYFTVGMASLILEDRATAARRNESPVLGADPFIGHQDWDISNLAIEVKGTDAFKTTASVTFMNAGKPEKIALELLRSGNDWRIADVEWESGSLRGLYRRRAAQDSEGTQPALR